ncbi:hypothetical protein [Calothrix sp. UHCC 0171]|uniref:hypothetical protein n=1 Tax=Calothrix sp. UHCC 0171 TaxID=3110245 RepID=UPI002B20996B|nr:hypothetical protein [Calothrix sp. UHCC 0171]MEA5573631.1 hypothetical protein [Calothrix sp. UHCC 0171]
MMKRAIIATTLIAIPLGFASLLPKTASAAEVRLQAGGSHSSVIITQQRGYSVPRNQVRRPNVRRPNVRQRRVVRRVWVPAYWENTTSGRRWVPGRWVYRR